MHHHSSSSKTTAVTCEGEKDRSSSRWGNRRGEGSRMKIAKQEQRDSNGNSSSDLKDQSSRKRREGGSGNRSAYQQSREQTSTPPETRTRTGPVNIRRTALQTTKMEGDSNTEPSNQQQQNSSSDNATKIATDKTAAVRSSRGRESRDLRGSNRGERNLATPAAKAEEQQNVNSSDATPHQTNQIWRRRSPNDFASCDY